MHAGTAARVPQRGISARELTRSSYRKYLPETAATTEAPSTTEAAEATTAATAAETPTATEASAALHKYRVVFTRLFTRIYLSCMQIAKVKLLNVLLKVVHSPTPIPGTDID
nr:hypothetical protein [Alicyclobacillus mengziensis]